MLLTASSWLVSVHGCAQLLWAVLP